MEIKKYDNYFCDGKKKKMEVLQRSLVFDSCPLYCYYFDKTKKNEKEDTIYYFCLVVVQGGWWHTDARRCIGIFLVDVLTENTEI